MGRKKVREGGGKKESEGGRVGRKKEDRKAPRIFETWLCP